MANIEFGRPTKPGPTGRFPLGSLRPDDEGEIAIGLGMFENKGVVLDFGKPVTWVGLDREVTVQLISNLKEKLGSLVDSELGQSAPYYLALDGSTCILGFPKSPIERLGLSRQATLALIEGLSDLIGHAK